MERKHPRRRHVRQVAALAGVGIAAAAVAIPALAQTQPAIQPVVDSDANVSTAAPAADLGTSTPASDQSAEQAALDQLNNFTPEQRVAFLEMFMTPQERFAFTLYISPPEQRAAILAFLDGLAHPAPAALPQVSGPVRTTTPATQTGRGGSHGGTNNGFLNCVRGRESGGNYGATNRSSGASGAYQFMQGTWNSTAQRAGRPDLVGRSPASASAADQDAMAQQLYSSQGSSPWGGSC
jgi:hypothetical protein